MKDTNSAIVVLHLLHFHLNDCYMISVLRGRFNLLMCLCVGHVPMSGTRGRLPEIYWVISMIFGNLPHFRVCLLPCPSLCVCAT